jgi:C4-dicarboxylate-specific signal transduction histidine kinase
MLIGLLIVGWVTTAWLSADYYYGNRSNNLYRQESQLAMQQAELVARNINENIELLKGISLVVSREEETHRALRRFGANAAPSILGYEVRKQQWTQDKVLGELNDSLSIAATNLGTDNIFIINAAGDCIAAGNADKPGSSVGSNYADRVYFPQAQAGQPGHQYAVGRTTNIPGLFYAYPVLEKGRFLGAVVVKRDITQFSHWTSQANAFIADANGVIVLTSDKRLEFRALPNASVTKLSAEKRLLQYKRSVLEPLEITPWGSARFPSAVLVGGKNPPLVFASKSLPEDAITIHVPRPLDEIVRLDTERGWFFLLLAAACSMLIVAVSAVVYYMQRIRQLNEDLDAKVKQRTQQLLAAQEELVRKEKLAVLGQVAGSVGHELRNPLGVMSNAVYFLQTVLADADETTREYLNIIQSEIAASERIVSDLLDSVRTKPPQPETVGVQELLEQTLRKLSIPPSVAVQLDIPATLSALRVDAQQIHQVLRNLISNGVEAMPQGGTLQIRAKADEAAKKIIVSVRDSGLGMTAQQLDRLFQPLFTTKPRGIGLGLVVVKNLTQANGGTIEVESEAGKGTLFTVTLPATDETGISI